MCELEDVFIVGAARTPIGSFLGSLKNFKASDLGGFAIKEALRRAGVAGEDVGEVAMGNVVSAGMGQAPAKQALIKGGIPAEIVSTLRSSISRITRGSTISGSAGSVSWENPVNRPASRKADTTKQQAVIFPFIRDPPEALHPHRPSWMRENSL